MRLARLFAGAAVGAGLMYLLDPEGGRRRRALLRDQLVSAAHKTTDAVDATSRDMTNRARGVVAELRGRFSQSEEHTSELQSHSDLVCRLLLEKKKKKKL